MTVKTLEFKKRGHREYCRICGNIIHEDEPRLSTTVSGFRRYISIAIHAYHIHEEDIEKLIKEDIYENR